MALLRRKEEHLDLNLTPMIDVVFLLVIFFMVGARFTEDVRDIDLRLPSVPTSDTATSTAKVRTVSIYQDGAIRLDGELHSLPELSEQLRQSLQSRPDLSVSVHGDAGVAFQHVANVLAACKQAGIRDVAVTVRIGSE